MQICQDHARLNHCKALAPVDLDNRLHAQGRQHDAAGNRNRAARAPCAARARRDGHARFARHGQRRQNIFCAFREHDRVRHDADRLRFIAHIALACVRIGQHLRRPKHALEQRPRLVASRRRRSRHIRTAKQHAASLARPPRHARSTPKTAAKSHQKPGRAILLDGSAAAARFSPSQALETVMER